MKNPVERLDLTTTADDKVIIIIKTGPLQVWKIGLP